MRFFAVAIFLVSAVSRADGAPVYLVHEGRLLGADDQPVDNAALAMKFEIFVEKLADTGQTPVWSADCTVEVAHGNYAVTLGDDCGSALTTDALPFGQARYLQVTVDGTALEPRLRLGVVPAAAEAGDALTVGGLAPDAFWQKTDAVDAATLATHPPTDFWMKSDAVDAATLGGTAPSDFWMKADAVDAATLDGKSLAELDARYLQPTGGGSLTLSGEVQAGSFAGDGAKLTGLDASQLSTGTVPDGVLPGDLARTDAAQTFVQAQTFGALAASNIVLTGSIRLGNDPSACSSQNAGALRYTGSELDICTDSAWTPIPLGRIGAKTSPGHSCQDILSGGGSNGDGTYWIDPDGTGPFEVYCDMTDDGGGWTMVFKLSQNAGLAGAASVASLWENGVAVNDTDATLLGVTKSTSQYVSRFVGKWNSGPGWNVTDARVHLYSGGTLKKFIKFRATGTNATGWFAPANLEASSWSDMTPGATYNYFSIDGDTGRKWFINASYGGCPADSGWLVGLFTPSGEGCPWEATASDVPRFIYAPGSTVTDWTNSQALADVFAVFVR